MSVHTSLAPGNLSEFLVHDGATVVTESPLTVRTSTAQWAYALSCAPAAAAGHNNGALAQPTRFVLALDVVRGRVGVGWTDPEGRSFIVEKMSAEPSGHVTLVMPAGVPLGRLIVRNASEDGASEFVVRGVRIEPLPQDAVQYPVTVAARDFTTEARPTDGDTATFDTEEARALNMARVSWLERARLPVEGARVLDVGTGVGTFIPHYLQRGCTVVAVDGREENIQELRRRHPGVEAHVADVQTLDPAALGTFDVVHCFGLLYHLESPIAAMRRFHAMCHRLLILETMVCDATSPVMVLADETKTFSQALAGLGCRPSPSFVAMALNRIGFPYIYGASPAPRHEDFDFTFSGNLDTTRDGHPLRSLFVASHGSLDCPMLVPLID